MSATNGDLAQIKDLEELLLSENRKIKIIGHVVKPVAESDESVDNTVEITVEQNAEVNVLHAVAVSPKGNNPVGFKDEIGFYKDLLPAVKEFQQEHGISASDYFAEFYGARLSLNRQSDVVDGDALILLQNLKALGFEIPDKNEGFDLHSTKAVLAKLANFQATVLALRKTKPDIFNSRILPYLHEHASANEPLDLEVILNEKPNTTSLVGKVKRVLGKKRFKKIREPWATFTHNQLWSNNVAVKPDEEAVKLLDFQRQDYGSPATDVLFFLLTSVRVSVLQYHFDKLLQHYFREFTGTLKQYKIDQSEYTYDSLQEELKLESSYQLYRALSTLFKAFGEVSNGTKGSRTPLIKFPLALKERVWFIVEQAAKQNWL